MKTLEIIHIEWFDSESVDGWTKVEDMDFNSLKTVHTVGVLLHKSEKLFVVTCAFDESTHSANATIFIPVVCVKEAKLLCQIPIMNS